MEVLLSQNIKANRKRLAMTQEQLAEAMNVSVGTVSKWESGSSAPDIEMIVELADFFQESVDVLLGYQWRHRSAGQTVEYLRTLRMEHQYEEGRKEIRKALQKFPNQVEVLYECGEFLYDTAVMRTKPGMDNSKEETGRCLRQALDVFQKVVQLLEQKNSSAINSLKVHQRIGIIYGTLGQKEEAISYLKRHNVFDLNDWIISSFLAELRQYDKAWDTVTAVFQHRAFELFQCCQTMYSVLINSRKYEELLKFAFWMEGFCLSVQNGKSSYYVRAEAITDAMIAVAFAYKSIDVAAEDFLDAERWLRKAIEKAGRFDTAPDYSGKTCFTSNISEAIYDGHRDSAILAVQDVILCCKEDEKEFSVMREIFDSIVSEIGHDEWRIEENDGKSEKKLLSEE